MTKLEELIAKLSELFELDKADLDFGIHRIIKSKHKQVREYLETRLPQQVETHLGQLAQQESASQLDELKEQVVSSFGDEAINEAGEINEAYAKTPLGEKYQVVRESSAGAQASGKVENEVYSHLLEFFSRYYEDADFMSLRRRTAGRESYAIPYNGEEVVLHWANKDQYYIKSSEDLKDYTFTVPLDSKEDGKKGRVQFRLTKMDAVQNNNKASRIFQLDDEQEILATDDGLVIPFHFAEGKKRAKAAEAEWEESILDSLPKKWQERLDKEDSTYTGSGERNVLQKHLRNYTKKNTSDYFIHKDLGGFLRRELDFYVKNEVMFLDDVENRPEGYLNGELRKIKAIRAVAHDLIDFMKQFEDFQKKLWLKKKFVVETNWCITLDRIPEEFYPEIAACDAQREEWVKLFAIDEIGGDLHEPKYSEPLSRSFLQANTGLFLNTIFFTEKFKQNIIAGFSDLDSDVEGSLFNSENYQAMNFFKRRYHESIKTIFIDPPYNTGGDGFAYKDSYKHSSWLSFMHDRGQLAKQLLSDNGTFTFSIDEIEAAKAWELFRGIFGPENFATDFVWEKKKKPSFLHRNIGKLNDYIFTFTRDYKSTFPFSVESTTEGKKTPLNNAGNNLGVLRFRSQSVRFNIPDGVIHAQDMSEGNIKTKLLEDVEIVNGTNSNELVLEGEWRYSQAKLDEVISESGELYISKVPFRPNHIKSGGEIKKMKNIMSPIHYKMETNEDATSQIEDLFGSEMFKNPKPEKLIRYLLKGTTYQSSESHLILDFFAGSGTTGHAVLNLNRDDRNNRRVVLVEMGEHFDTVLIPRLMKAAYSTTWNQGKPASRTTNVPFAFKYIRLESYEDTLNNLALTDQSPDLLGQPRELQDEYLLRYCLDTETSESLLDCEQFKDPFNYQLKIYDRESGEAKPTKVDLPETFNYLLGLKVRTMQMKEETLVIEGENPAAETVLVIWRNVESMDNKKLDKFVSKTLRINTADTEYAAIYINGDTTLNDPHKKILLTEQVFHDLMFDVEDV